MNKKEDMQDFIICSDTTMRSVDWWEKQVEKALDELSAIEKRDPLGVDKNNKKELKKLHSRIELLLERGNLEKENLKKLESQLKNIIADARMENLRQIVTLFKQALSQKIETESPTKPNSEEK